MKNWHFLTIVPLYFDSGTDMAIVTMEDK